MIGKKRNRKKIDQKAQRALFDQYNQKLIGVAVRYVSSMDDAKDVLQESFIRIFKYMPKADFDNRSMMEAWMVKITVNEALRWLKKGKKHQNEELIENVSGHMIVNQEDTQKQDLLRLIHTLPDGYRVVFNLYSIEGYSHKEIGELLKITESSSRSQLTRARQLLQRKLNGQYERAK